MVQKSNPNRPGTLEHAVRHAMNSLGPKAVSKVLECSESRLYKATQVSPSRSLPDITWSQIEKLVTMLKNQRSRRKYMQEPDKTEYFSDILRGLGRTKTIPSTDIHNCMTMATRDSGELAAALIEVTTAQARRGNHSLTLDESARCAAKGRQAMASISKVIAVCDYHAKSEDGEAVVVEIGDNGYTV